MMIIGKVNLINCNYSFPVKWDKEEFSSWIGLKISGSNFWKQVGRNVLNKKSAIYIAQRHIDIQYGDRY